MDSKKAFKIEELLTKRLHLKTHPSVQVTISPKGLRFNIHSDTINANWPHGRTFLTRHSKNFY